MDWDNRITGLQLAPRAKNGFLSGALVSAAAMLALAPAAQAFDAVFELSSLDGSNGFVLNGVNAGNRAGSAVAGAGDINNDGFDDLLVSAISAGERANAGVNSASQFGFSGHSYVIFGNAGVGASGSLELSSLNGANGFVVSGIDGEDGSGFSLSNAGDFNADGIGDFLIGAPGASVGANNDRNGGEAYIVFGGTGVGSNGAFNLSSLNGSNGIIFRGEMGSEDFGNFQTDGDEAGYSVSAAGDVNNDGVEDILVGARNAGAGGRTYVVFGGMGVGNSSGLVDLGGLNGSDGFAIDGPSQFDRAGESVSAAGDINGDGIDDLLIGAPRAQPNNTFQTGEAYVVFGGGNIGSSGDLSLAAIDGSNGFSISSDVGTVGNFDVGDLGISVSGLGDVNGDGIDDVLVGAPGSSPDGRATAGTSYVVFGGAGVGNGGRVNVDNLNGSDGFVLNGVSEQDRTSQGVGRAGDVNGDGINDFLIGAAGADPNGNSGAGQSYLVFGGLGIGATGVIELSDLDGESGVTFQGNNAFDISGRNLEGVGDINGDGLNDFLIGAIGVDPDGRNLAGAAYLVFGQGEVVDTPVPASLLLLASGGLLLRRNRVS